jgi:hypothetical protein
MSGLRDELSFIVKGPTRHAQNREQFEVFYVLFASISLDDYAMKCCILDNWMLTTGVACNGVGN